ncbi:MAG TPA: hypothetical protein PK874_13985 [Desulfobacteraceae bacterium]|nr:hypothetical protein [Desulfobacteraceae bacterium]
MMRVNKVSLIAALALVMTWALWIAGCATTYQPVKTACKADIEWQITPEAEVTEFNCETGTHAEEPSLIFTVGVKNISHKPLRYRVNIFLLDMDKAAGHLVPRKGKPPVLEPGKSQSVKIPFIKTTDMPKKVLVVIKTMEI